ncbi:MAG TPA: hypothetical protein VGD30_04040 [Telluria sp.]
MTTDPKPAGRSGKLIRMLGLAILFAGIGGAAGFFSLNYQGYCFERGGVVSDQEKIEVAVGSLLGMLNAQKQGTPGASPAAGNDLEGGKQVIYYADAEEFFRVNPNCCSVSKEIHDEGRHRLDDIDRAFGFVSDFVTIKYVQRYRDDKGIEHQKTIKTHYVVDQCGNKKTI